MMPSGISYFLHLGISDRSKFREQVMDYFNGPGIQAEIDAEIERVEEQYGIDPLEDLVNLVDDEIAWFAIEGLTGNREDELFVLETRSRSETVEVVMRWIEQYSRFTHLICVHLGMSISLTTRPVLIFTSSRSLFQRDGCQAGCSTITSHFSKIT